MGADVRYGSPETQALYGSLLADIAWPPNMTHVVVLTRADFEQRTEQANEIFQRALAESGGVDETPQYRSTKLKEQGEVDFGITQEYSKYFFSRSPAGGGVLETNRGALGIVIVNPGGIQKQKLLEAALGSELAGALVMPGTDADWERMALLHEIRHSFALGDDLSDYDSLRGEIDGDSFALKQEFARVADPSSGPDPLAQAFHAMRALASIERAPHLFNYNEARNANSSDFIHATSASVEADGSIVPLDLRQNLRDLVAVKTTTTAFLDYMDNYDADPTDSDYATYDAYRSYRASMDYTLQDDVESGTYIMGTDPNRTYATLKAMRDLGLPEGEAGKIYVREYIEAIEKYAPTIANNPENEAIYKKAMQELPSVYAGIAPQTRGIELVREPAKPAPPAQGSVPSAS